MRHVFATNTSNKTLHKNDFLLGIPLRKSMQMTQRDIQWNNQQINPFTVGGVGGGVDSCRNHLGQTRRRQQKGESITHDIKIKQ